MFRLEKGKRSKYCTFIQPSIIMIHYIFISDIFFSFFVFSMIQRIYPIKTIGYSYLRINQSIALLVASVHTCVIWLLDNPCCRQMIRHMCFLLQLGWVELSKIYHYFHNSIKEIHLGSFLYNWTVTTLQL